MSVNRDKARPAITLEYSADERRRLANLRRAVNRARRFPDNTDPYSRHLHIIAEYLSLRKPYPMLLEEPEHCGETMLVVLWSLWKLRNKVARDQKRRKNGLPAEEGQ